MTIGPFELDTIVQGDCLELMKQMPDGCVDLVVVDPPYNIDKVRAWDKWKKKEDYVEWMGKLFIEYQRVLKDNGSFYWFHNDMEQVAELMIWIKQNTRFVFKQFIVWNKRFDEARNKGFLDGFVETGGLRNYQRMAEYCLFYTFQDETGLTTVMLDTNNFRTLRKYFKEYQEALGLSKNDILTIIGQQADHCFRWGSSQWDMPTEETYKEIGLLPLKTEFVRREYEDLRREYEDLRYTFNNQKTHHSVWNYEIAERCDHVTPKPVDLIENIIKHSSNDGDIIMDSCMGSGTTAIACIRTNRHFIGFEIDAHYCEIANKRIELERQQLRLAL
jgi:site-specific DNA-methyltransferase (adenine-specific)